MTGRLETPSWILFSHRLLSDDSVASSMLPGLATLVVLPRRRRIKAAASMAGASEILQQPLILMSMQN
jgi:heme A synthase